MGNLMYLVVAAGVILLGVIVVALRNRTPRTIDSGIRAHERHMGALSLEARRSLLASNRRTAPPPASRRIPRRTARE
jgi:hypothetical protein